MKLDPNTSEWINLFARWIHAFTGILWIGQTYFFTWLDARLSEEEAARKGDAPAQLWMVHSGGFYVVEKQKAAELTRKLHWFRWEAALTWLSGLVLLVLVYYMGGALVDTDVRDISVNTATAISVGLLILGWVVYDLLCLTPLVKYEMPFAALAYVLVVGLAFGLTHIFSGRAAYIQLGTMFGTIMAANVWMRILPAQKRMIAATREGKQGDAGLATRAKLRSKHNTFMVVPLVFTMISNHFPTATYGRRVQLDYSFSVGSGQAGLLQSSLDALEGNITQAFHWDRGRPARIERPKVSSSGDTSNFLYTWPASRPH